MRNFVVCFVMSALVAIVPSASNSQVSRGNSAVPSSKLAVRRMTLPGEGRGDYLAVDAARIACLSRIRLPSMS